MANLRVAAVEQMQGIVGSERDPLAIVVQIAVDPKMDIQTRLGAAAIALPYLYPRLSATTVQATTLTAKVDATELIDRLSQRFGRLAAISCEPEPEAA